MALTNDKLIHSPGVGSGGSPFPIPRRIQKKGIRSLEDFDPIVLPYGSGSFRCIEIDPPWQYNDAGYNGFSSVQKYRIHCPYPTMSLPELWLMGDEINRVAHDRSHLWMWTTKDFLLASLLLLWSWGWDYKQTFTWIKTTDGVSAGLKGVGGMSKEARGLVEDALLEFGLPGKPKYGMGQWGRNGCEYLLFAVNQTRKNPMLKAKSRIPNYFFAPSGKHSAKPGSAYDLIRSLSPGERLSIFQRADREGFHCWGNETGTQEELWAKALPLIDAPINEGDPFVPGDEEDEEDLPDWLGA